MGDTGQTCLISVDGVDFKIPEPQPFCPGWYLHKFKSSGSSLKNQLGPGEKVVTDCGYKGDCCICHPDLGTNEQKFAMGAARARHKTINGCIKN
eukprot:2374452-Ditylum_brightwellii.AAC.1